MFERVKGFFEKITNENTQAGGRDALHDVHVAACALFMEIGRIDETFSAAEMDLIVTVLKEKYGLRQENVDALMALADAELKQSVDLWQFARLINANYSIEEKIDIIEILWQIVFVDGHMDKYENYMMHKLSNLLRLSHNQLIDAKLKVLHRAG